MFNSVLVKQKGILHVDPSIPRIQKWTNSINITAYAPSSITCSRMFNSQVVQSIPEECFEIGNYKLKHQNMPVQDMLEKEKLNKLEEYSTLPPKAVTAADLLENQVSGEYTESCSYKFLRGELPVRMAHLLMELQHLPKELRLEEKMLFLMESYSVSFSELIEFEKREPDQQTLLEFKDQLVTMRKRHKDTQVYMAEACNAMKEKLSINSNDINNHVFSAAKIFLDRLYTNRIGIHMITDQHLHMYGDISSIPYIPSAPQRTGIIVPNTNLLESLRYATDEATVHTENVYSQAAPRVRTHCHVSVNGKSVNSDPTGHFIPQHLFNIFYELLMNSLRAVVEYHWDSGKFPPVDVHITQCNDDFSIKVSDQGGGMDRDTSAKVFHYQFSKPSTFKNNHVMGYGLPLARLYARYFHGELKVTSYDGYGTDMHVYLTNLSGSAQERLPIYTKESVETWSQPEEENNWSSHIWSKMEWWNGDKVGPIHQIDEKALERRNKVSFLRLDVEEETKTK